MQWLVDLVIKKIRLDGLAVNRGDAGAPDLTEADIVTDGAWHDLDLTAIVPTNANVVTAHVRLRSTAVNRFVYVRTKGHAGHDNKSSIITLIANVISDGDIIMYPNADGMLEYRAWDGTINWFRLTVKGWDF